MRISTALARPRRTTVRDDHGIVCRPSPVRPITSQCRVECRVKARRHLVVVVVSRAQLYTTGSPSNSPPARPVTIIYRVTVVYILSPSLSLSLSAVPRTVSLFVRHTAGRFRRYPPYDAERCAPAPRSTAPPPPRAHGRTRDSDFTSLPSPPPVPTPRRPGGGVPCYRRANETHRSSRRVPAKRSGDDDKLPTPREPHDASSSPVHYNRAAVLSRASVAAPPPPPPPAPAAIVVAGGTFLSAADACLPHAVLSVERYQRVQHELFVGHFPLAHGNGKQFFSRALRPRRYCPSDGLVSIFSPLDPRNRAPVTVSVFSIVINTFWAVPSYHALVAAGSQLTCFAWYPTDGTDGDRRCGALNLGDGYVHEK